MIYKIAIAASAAALMFAIAGCKPDDKGSGGSPTTDGKNPQQIMMMQPWLWAEDLDSAETGSSWVNNQPDCNSDDVYTFKTTTKISVDEGDKDCLPTTDRVYEMNWSMPDPNGKTVVLPDGTFTIIEQTNTEMILTTSYFVGGETHFFKKIFRKK